MPLTDSTARRILVPLLEGVDAELTTTLAAMFVTDRTDKVLLYRPVRGTTPDTARSNRHRART